MNNKYKIGDKVIYQGEVYRVYKYFIKIDSNEYSYCIYHNKIETIQSIAKENELQPYIEEDKQDNKQLKKFNKGNKVKLTYNNEVKHGVIFNVNDYDSYDVVIYGEDGFTTYHAEWIELDIQEGETQKHLCALCDKETGNIVYGSEFGFICEKCNSKKLPITESTIGKSIENDGKYVTLIGDFTTLTDEHALDKITIVELENKYNNLEELYEGAKMAIKLLSKLLPSTYKE